MKKSRGKTKEKKPFKEIKKKILIFSFVIILLIILFLLVIKNIKLTGDATEDETCISNWKCSEFFPEKCPREEIRTRNCIDLNNCGNLESRPDLTQPCERKNFLFYFIIIAISIIVLYLISIIIKRIFKKKEKLKERPKAKDKHYKNDPNYPSDIEQYYGSDQTHNFKSQKKPKNTKKNEEEIQEEFPDKYWPK